MTDAERLERFEAVLAEVLAEQEQVAAPLEELRVANKVKTATYQQLTARKLALKSTVALFEDHGLLEG